MPSLSELTREHNCHQKGAGRKKGMGSVHPDGSRHICVYQEQMKNHIMVILSKVVTKQQNTSSTASL